MTEQEKKEHTAKCRKWREENREHWLTYKRKWYAVRKSRTQEDSDIGHHDPVPAGIFAATQARIQAELANEENKIEKKRGIVNNWKSNPKEQCKRIRKPVSNRVASLKQKIGKEKK